MARYERRRRIRPAPAETTVSAWPFVGMILVACDFFLCFASVLIAPWWVSIVFFLLWVVLFGASVTWWTPFPRRIVPGALVGALVWFVVLVAGGVWLGWS